ncbi:MAG: LCP family protein [Clostridiales bacterium]|nr:LCP family protein [Clostridiales bacterium]
MKTHFKIFISAFIIFSLFIGSAIFAFDKYYDVDLTVQQDVELNIDKEATHENSVKTELDRLSENSNRINVLIFGTDGGRADTIMVVSYDFEKQIVDLVSIPRDTYHYVPGHELQGQNKINAVYGFPGDEGGSLGLKETMEELLGIPISYYVKVNYEGVKAVVDVLGGVEVKVPFDMKYDDPAADPPLHIDIKAGTQLLSGSKAMEYLRWRKNNDESGEGDLPRITRQQEFMKLLAKKSLSYKLPTVANTVFQYIKTNMSLDKVLFYSTKAVGFDIENMNRYRIPGDVSNDGGGFYIHDPELTYEMMLEIYKQ